MALLESFDPSSMRKTRRGSFMMLSNMNLAQATDEEKQNDDSQMGLLEEEGHGGGHGHHHVLKTNQQLDT